MKSKLQKIKEELLSYSQADRLFVLFAMLCSFFITMEASIVKAVANSTFITDYGVAYLPYVWIATVPFNYLLVNFYNKLLPKIGPLKMQLIAMAVAFGINLFGSFYLDRSHTLSFFLYMWKDIYIMLMFQQLWSVIHATMDTKRAKYLYGILFGMGGIGSAIGSTVPGFFAVKFGSSHLLLATLPIYFILGFCYYKCLAVRDTTNPITFKNKQSNFFKGVKLIYQSQYLKYILLLVVLMQVISTLLDFNFNFALQEHIHTKDLRTEFLGRLFGIVNTTNIFLQFIGSFLFIQGLGLKRSHLFVPVYLFAVVGLSTLNPLFTLVAFSFASTKCLDYSLFTIIKEMLYIPLPMDEKFKAKAIIDVFAYRSSKALASLCIISLQFFFPVHPLFFVSLCILIFCIFWVTSIPKIFSHYETLTTTQ